MPKVHLTTAERQKANYEKEFRKQEKLLRATIQDKLDENGFTDREFQEKAKLGSIATVTKFKKHPFTLSGDTLVKCCVAAGIVLGVISNDEKQ